MTLVEMRKEFAIKVGVSQEKAKELIAALEEVVVDGLLQDGKVAFGTIGSLETKDVAERTGRNPQNGELITIPASRRVKFKTSKAIKEIVNK